MLITKWKEKKQPDYVKFVQDVEKEFSCQSTKIGIPAGNVD